MKPDPRLVRMRDWLDATMGPAPALDALLARIGDDAGMKNPGRLVAPGVSPRERGDLGSPP